MSTDLVEIALDRLTDWQAFEKLAAEVMRDEGYPDIRPLGGSHDHGEDAIVERFYEKEGERTRVVFQFSLRPDIMGKVNETIETLDAKGIKYSKLVMVTPRAVSAERQRKVKRQALEDKNVDLDIIERKVIINRLADRTNGMFQRCFPDIEKQVAALCRQDPDQHTSRQAARESEYLKVCYAFAFAGNTTRTRKSVLDLVVLGVLAARHPDALTPSEVQAAADADLGKAVLADDQQVKAALGRLLTKGLVSNDPPKYSLSALGWTQIEAAQATREARMESAISDIVADVIESSGDRADDSLMVRLHENARIILAEYFRTNGLELADSFLQAGPPKLLYGDDLPHLTELATRRIPAHFGQLLLTAIGRALSCPTDEQACYFANCSRSYLALQVINADPSLREFQATRFRSKTFVLDTDVVLDAVVRDLPTSAPYRNLVTQLVSMGAVVLVPEEVLSEVVTHFDISPRTYDYFGDQLSSLPEELGSVRQ